MFTFIKKLFGFDQPTMKEAGVQIEQAPYKVPEPVAVTPIPLVAAPVEVAPTVAPVAETAPSKLARKQRAPKTGATPVAKTTAPVKKAAAMKAAPKKPRSKKT